MKERLTVWSFFGVIFIITILANSNDRIEDWKVTQLSRNHVEVVLSERLTNGTDANCEKSEAIVKNFIDKGYTVTVRSSLPGGWIPFPKHIIKTRKDLPSFTADMDIDGYVAAIVSHPPNTENNNDIDP